MNFPDGRSLATNQDYYWLEYQCFLPNDTTVVEAKIPNPEDYGAVLPNYTQPFEDAPLPDGTVCTVRGCFYQTGSSIYRFIVPNNCTVDTDECAKETHDCGGNSLCNNTVGGYECVCEDGYSPLDDRNC
ncbi:Adhesion G protein-coupled receptor E5, partial [Geodia barretti]